MNELGIDQSNVNLGSSLMWTGSMLLEILSAIVMQLLGAIRWLSIQAIVCGIMATSQSSVSNRAGVLATFGHYNSRICTKCIILYFWLVHEKGRCPKKVYSFCRYRVSIGHKFFGCVWRTRYARHMLSL